MKTGLFTPGSGPAPFAPDQSEWCEHELKGVPSVSTPSSFVDMSRPDEAPPDRFDHCPKVSTRRERQPDSPQTLLQLVIGDAEVLGDLVFFPIVGEELEDCDVFFRQPLPLT